MPDTPAFAPELYQALAAPEEMAIFLSRQSEKFLFEQSRKFLLTADG